MCAGAKRHASAAGLDVHACSGPLCATVDAMPDASLMRRASRSSKARIYVQMPAYRDTELNATLSDLFAKAASPALLRVAVAWQRNDGERLAPTVRRLPGLELLESPANKSRGVNWARALLQRRWSGEKYTLFLDSHHRFVRGWDALTIDMYERLRSSGVRKPIITAHLPAYRPELEPAGRRMQPYKIYPHSRENGLLTKLTSFPVHSWRSLDLPVKADFISLHFLFASGTFNRDLPFDPAIYFSGDEVATSLRAFCAGYDAYHPHRIVGWHSYDRTTRIPHWNDHLDAPWQNSRSLAVLARLFSGRRTGRFALKRRRSIRQYEEHIMCPLATRT